ncbi:MAG: recombinase zinc beta ribbon domain-containing protein [Bacteroidetes bacterium]|nr:recombinase zinc beta ribbon domain-containing protein [Bacteroidota bacterium]
MVCSKCGYHYQGQTSGKRGHNYYRYVCGGYNSKGICDFIPIKRDPLETFVLQSIVSSFDQYRLPGLIQKHLERMVKLRPEAERELEAQLTLSANEVDKKLRNIRKAVEEGASYRTFQQRVDDLEREKEQLQHQIEENRLKLNQAFSIDSVAPIVQKFMSQFEEIMNTISIPEKREVVRRCVERIYVDHDKRKISCYIRKVPIVNKEIMDIYSEGLKQQPATFRSPVVIEDVAGEGLEPTTYGL